MRVLTTSGSQCQDLTLTTPSHSQHENMARHRKTNDSRRVTPRKYRHTVNAVWQEPEAHAQQRREAHEQNMARRDAAMFPTEGGAGSAIGGSGASRWDGRVREREALAADVARDLLLHQPFADLDTHPEFFDDNQRRDSFPASPEGTSPSPASRVWRLPVNMAAGEASERTAVPVQGSSASPLLDRLRQQAGLQQRRRTASAPWLRLAALLRG